MYALESFKASLRDIGCDFVTSPSLLGIDIVIYSGAKKILFEFDTEGRFLKTKIE